MGEIVPLKPSGQLPLKSGLKLRFTIDDARKLIGRFVAVYGDAPVADSTQRALVQREYVEQFGGYDPRQVQDAASALIRTSKFWPRVSEIADTIQKQLASAHAPAQWCNEESRMCGKPRRECCGAAPTETEIARRKAFMREMRAVYGSVFAREGTEPPAHDDLSTLKRPFAEHEIENARRLMERVRGGV
jgi:hypothetical protein